MNRRRFIAGLGAAAMLPHSAWAQGFADGIVRQLRAQGYSGITVSNTWLGRTRIIAESGQGSREIIIDPRTGEILRDLFTGSGPGSGIVDRGERSGGRGSGNGDDDDHDDDDDDDEDEDDEEGESGNSGSGGGDRDDDDDDDE